MEASDQPRSVDGLPPHLLIILNRQAAQKRLDRFKAVLSLLADAGCTYEVKETHTAGDAARYAAEADPNRINIIAIAGGDGTINDAINGFQPNTPPLGLIPLGTTNVLAHEIGLKTDAGTIAATLMTGAPLAVVPGQVNGHRFMMMASIGFDAHVVGGVSRAVKRRIGKIAYILEAFRQLVRYSCPHLVAKIDGKPVTAATLVVSRGRLYGGRFVMAPNADIAKAEFSVALFPRKGRLAMLGYSLALPLGLLNRCNLITHIKAQSVEAANQDGDPVQADGDITARLPAVIRLADHPITLLVPHPRPHQP
jgi:YegS/Rv2252/BmrU family lipid kinase